MTTVHDLILQHPTNPISNTGYQTASDKHWARSYKPIRNIICHTRLRGRTHADFETAFLPLQEDDTLRLSHEAVHPNSRHWRLETEADCENWFNTEIISVVLAAWFSYPAMTQTSHTKPLTENTISENIDITFSTKINSRRLPIAVGEIKRNLLDPDAWREGRAADSSQQRKLSQELRGYAHKYSYPQVFCFDGDCLLLLQFRANRVEDIEDESCPVDCWVLPVEDTECPLRYGLYRLLVQGWRRCQGSVAPTVSVGGLVPSYREFFSGLPVWHNGVANQKEHPYGYQRSVDENNGALRWTHAEYPLEWETGAFW